MSMMSAPFAIVRTVTPKYADVFGGFVASARVSRLLLLLDALVLAVVHPFAAAPAEDVPVPGGTNGPRASARDGVRMPRIASRFMSKKSHDCSTTRADRTEGTARAYLFVAARQAAGASRHNVSARASRRGCRCPGPADICRAADRSSHHRAARLVHHDHHGQLGGPALSSAWPGSTTRRSVSCPAMDDCSAGLLERSATAFAVAAGSLHVENESRCAAGAARSAQGDRQEVEALWEGMVLEKVTQAMTLPAAVARVERRSRLRSYDVIGEPRFCAPGVCARAMDANGVTRAERFKALTAGIGAYRESHLRTLPLGRASYDGLMTLSRLEAAPDGTPAAPGARGFWSRAFGGGNLPGRCCAAACGMPRRNQSSAAWLANPRAGRRACARRAARPDRVRPAAVRLRGPGGAAGHVDRHARAESVSGC